MCKVSFWNIFKVFFKIGAILLGGGYVIVPIMKTELVEKRKWLDDEELCDFYCVSQCLPGIIAINMSVLVGQKLLNLKGAIAAIFGMSCSPFIAILLVASMLAQITKIPFMEGVLWGVNLSVIVLIYLALKEMWQKSILDNFCVFWFLLVLFFALLKVNPAYLIILSVFIGLIIQIIKDKKNA